MKLTQPHKELITLLTCQLAVFAMDEIEGTEAYRQDVKQTGNRFLKELLKATGPKMARAFGVQDDVMFQLIEYYTSVLSKLVKMHPEDTGVIGLILDDYLQNPDRVMKLLEIQFTEEI